MKKKSTPQQKPKIPLLLPREHVIFLCRLQAYRKDFEAHRARLEKIRIEEGKVRFQSPEWFSVRQRGKDERRVFAEKWGLKEPIDPKKEDVNKVSWVMPHTDSRVGDPVSIVRWKKAEVETPFEYVRLPICGLGTPIHETDLIGDRRLRIEVDLSYPWEGALEKELKAVIVAARKLAGAPRKVDGELFAARVQAASRALHSTSPSAIGKALEPWTYAATRKGDKAARESAIRKWKTLQQHVSDVLNP